MLDSAIWCLFFENPHKLSEPFYPSRKVHLLTTRYVCLYTIINIWGGVRCSNNSPQLLIEQIE